MRFGFKPNFPLIHFSQRLLLSERGDVFIIISVAISLVIITSVAGYQLLLANKGRANILLTESTDGFLFNELNAWSGYIRKKLNYPDVAAVPGELAAGDTGIVGFGGGSLGHGGIVVATGKSSATSDGVTFCGKSSTGNSLCIRGPGAGGGSPTPTTFITGLSCDEFITNYNSRVSGAIKISTKDEFRMKVPGGTGLLESGRAYELANDIDFANTDPELQSLENFYIDGKNFRLKNLQISHRVGSPMADHLGLFLRLKNGILRNVGFDNLQIRGLHGFSYKNVGAIAAVTLGPICFDKVSVSMGGIFNAAIPADTPIVSETVGGFVGLHAMAFEPTIFGAPSAEMGPALPPPEGTSLFAPIIDPAIQNFLEIRNSGSSEFRLAASGSIGGIVGKAESHTRVSIDSTQILSLMMLQTGGTAGGMVGSAERVELKKAKTSGVISVEGVGAVAGGIVGVTQSLEASDMRAGISVGRGSTFTGQIGTVGGVVAYMHSGSLTRVIVDSLVKGCLTTGGLIGEVGSIDSQTTTIDQSYVKMKVDNGLCNLSDFAARVTALSTGIIGTYTPPLEAVGGLVGRSGMNGDGKIKITNSYVLADVLGNQSALPSPMPTGTLPISYVGGLVGWGNADVSKSYFSGKLKGHQLLGGIFGRARSVDVPIRNVFVNITTSASEKKASNTLRYYEADNSNSLTNLSDSVHVFNAVVQASTGPGINSVNFDQRNNPSNFTNFDFTGIWKASPGLLPTLKGPFSY